MPAELRTVPTGVLQSHFLPIEPQNCTVYDFVFRKTDEYGEAPAFTQELPTPEGPKVIDMSFTKLKAQTRTVAKALLAKGVGKGDVVAVYSPNHIAVPGLMHGIMLAGAQLTTMNPTYEPREIAHQLDEASTETNRVKLFFCFRDIEGNPFKTRALEACATYGLPESSVIPIGEPAFEEFVASGAGAGDEALDAVTVSPDDVCALLSSSGTTGPPKVVQLTHRNVVANLQQMASTETYKAGDATIAFLPFFHIFGLTVIINVGIALGVRSVIMPKFVPADYLRMIKQYNAKFLHCVPPVAMFLIKAAPAEALDGLDFIMCAAAPLAPANQQQLQDKLRNGVVRQGYGMTELSPGAIVAKAEPRTKEKLGSIGMVLPSTEVKLEKIEDEEDPHRGLLYVRGPQVMLGYRGRDGVTRATIDQDGWLNTGDVATVDADGYFWIVDRVKELIKVKGLQVAPAELEGLINLCPKVAECAVIGIPHEKFGEIPKAFVVVRPGETLADPLAELNEHLKQQGTSEFKFLGEVELVEAVQKLASGKILRRNYREMERKKREG